MTVGHRVMFAVPDSVEHGFAVSHSGAWCEVCCA